MVMTQPDVQIGMDPFEVRVKGQEVENNGESKDPLNTHTENVKDVALHVHTHTHTKGGK